VRGLQPVRERLPGENCITLKELAIGSIDPRTGRAVQGYGSWSTHPNNPVRSADQGQCGGRFAGVGKLLRIFLRSSQSQRAVRTKVVQVWLRYRLTRNGCGSP